MTPTLTERVDPHAGPGPEQSVDKIEALTEREKARYEFAEAMCATQEEIDRFRPRLKELVEKAIASTGDVQAQKTLRMFLGIEEYKLFGQPNEPLPPGYAVVGSHKLNLSILTDPAAGYCWHCNNEALKRAGEQELEKMESELFKAKQERQAEIEEKALRFIQLTPIYKIFENLDATMPETISNPHSHSRQFKENEIREKIEKNGAKIDEASPAGFAARQKYLDAMVRLDFEEEVEAQQQRRTKGRPGSSLLIAKERLKQMLASSDPSSRGSSLVGMGRSMIADSKLVDSADELEYAAALDLSGELFGIVFDPNFKGTYQQALVEAAKRAASKGVSFELDTQATGRNYQAMQIKHKFRMPPNIPITEKELSSHSSEHHSWHYALEVTRKRDSTIEFVSKEEIARREKNVIGKVIHRYHQNEASRLVQNIDDLPPENFNTEGAHETLAITLKPSEFHGRPHIPGYRLISAHHDKDYIRYGFEEDPAGDPYARADMHVPEHSRFELAAKYESIGLHTLADALRATKHLRVADLVQLISGETYYPVVKSSRRSKLPASFVPKSLDDFKQVIKNKNLWAQCMGSGPFLAFSLQLCGFDSGTITGNLVDLSKQKIKEAPHMQTYLNYNGKRYILDATGSLSAADRLRSLASSAGKSVAEALKVFRRVGRKQPEAPPESHAPEILQTPRAAPITTPRERLQTKEITQDQLKTIADALQSSLAPLFGASTPEGLIKVLSLQPGGVEGNLEKGNPLYKAIFAARKAANNRITQEELIETAKYVANYAAKPNLARQKGLPVYQSTILTMLEAYLVQASRALADNK